ncbi:hypothetical protein EYF80_022687 [Liparis tanakae]|uniref:Uncharacterized protein n=1 Tax=Liparis tanakae TaxID=230148 RepID=A0A4Z2HN31_9TELE|nr:hypothetical protein EYF80_022687 [Liparis tanakae]
MRSGVGEEGERFSGFRRRATRRTDTGAPSPPPHLRRRGKKKRNNGNNLQAPPPFYRERLNGRGMLCGGVPASRRSLLEFGKKVKERQGGRSGGRSHREEAGRYGEGGMRLNLAACNQHPPLRDK